MRHHVKHLELFPTLGLKEYKHLYFTFNNDPDVVASNFLMNKKRKVKVHLLEVTRENVECIQQYMHSCSLQRVNRFFLASENTLIHHY